MVAVILSVAKDPSDYMRVTREILRCAQDDTQARIF
jgi:hypothetical protein